MKLSSLSKLLAASILCFTVLITPVFSQTVSVQSGDELGHGMLLKHGSTCYVLTPRHVANNKRRVTVFSSAPVVHSGALVETPFWEGMDFAIGVVRGPIEEKCVTTLDDLSGEVRLASGRRVQLLRLLPSGEIERIDMSVTKTDYLTLDARIEDGSSELFKGTSGAFLFDGEKPIGMIVEALSSTEGRFIRVEELHMNLLRRLNRKAGFQAAASNSTPVASNDDGDGLPLEFVRASQPPIYPDVAEANMLGDGSYVFDLPRPNRIAFKIKSPGAVPLSSVRVFSDVDADYAIPRSIRIDVSTAPDGNRPRFFSAAEMGPDGVFDFSRAPTLARWVFITVNDAWESGAIGISAVRVK
ncbi:hypothetical protein [Shimia sp. W99]